MHVASDQAFRLIAFGVVVLAGLATAVELASDAAARDGNPPAANGDPLRTELARCRMIAPEEAETDSACKQAWAENRRRFFGGALQPFEQE